MAWWNRRKRSPAAPMWRGAAWESSLQPPSGRTRLLRVLVRRRRLLAALLLSAAAALTVQQLTPADAVSSPVVLAAADLPAGHPLTSADVVAAGVSPAMVPAGAFSADRQSLWVGRQLAGPVRRGTVLTDAALLGQELLTGAPAGSQAVPLQLADPATLPLLQQGQHVTVVLSGPAAGLDGPLEDEVLARNVPVLWTPAIAASQSAFLPGPEAGALVVVAAPPAEAVALAGASARGKIFLVLVRAD